MIWLSFALFPLKREDIDYSHHYPVIALEC